MNRTPNFPRDRRGVALPLALFTLVIVAVMITAVFYVGRLEQRMGYNSLASTQAFEAAEAGVAAVLSNWNSSTYNALASGTTLTLPSAAVGSNAVYTASLQRLNSNLFLIQVEGRFLVGGEAITRRQVGRLVRFDPPDLDPEAAVASRQTLEVAGTASINGSDSVPPAWGAYCPSPGATAPGIRDSVGTITVTAPCTVPSCITGNPPVKADSTVTDASFHSWGNLTFEDMAAMVNKTISGSVGGIQATVDPGPGGACRTTDATNWGDPLNPGAPCGNYFPIIYAPGDVTLTDGWGQGILLVEGDLTIAGPVTFYGAVMVKGSVQATNGNLFGALTINSSTGTPTSIGGTATMIYSRCVLARVATGAAPPSALRERSWVQLY